MILDDSRLAMALAWALWYNSIPKLCGKDEIPGEPHKSRDIRSLLGTCPISSIWSQAGFIAMSFANSARVTPEISLVFLVFFLWQSALQQIQLRKMHVRTTGI